MQFLNPHFVEHVLKSYGAIALFGLLALGIFGLPIPDETLLVLAGFLMAKGKLSLVAIPIAAILGSCFGITFSYLVGLLAGQNTIRRFGRCIGVTEKKLSLYHAWFERFGKWLLLVGYFIPGVRHITGIMAGTLYLSYWRFALFAYLGALLWSSTFLTIGYFFYNAWQHFTFPGF